MSIEDERERSVTTESVNHAPENRIHPIDYESHRLPKIESTRRNADIDKVLREIAISTGITVLRLSCKPGVYFSCYQDDIMKGRMRCRYNGHTDGGYIFRNTIHGVALRDMENISTEQGCSFRVHQLR